MANAISIDRSTQEGQLVAFYYVFDVLKALVVPNTHGASKILPPVSPCDIFRARATLLVVLDVAQFEATYKLPRRACVLASKAGNAAHLPPTAKNSFTHYIGIPTPTHGILDQ